MSERTLRLMPWYRDRRALLVGAGYTIFSEWMNLSRQSWRYADAMPVLRAFGAEIGVSPLAQWLVIPPLALWLGRRRLLSQHRSSQS